MSKEEQIIEKLRRMIMWDEPQSDLDSASQHLERSPEEIRSIIQDLRNERIAHIRKINLGPAIQGLVIILGAVIVFCWYWFGQGGIQKKLAYLLIAGTLYGSWRFLSALSEIINAPRKRGSIANLE